MVSRVLDRAGSLPRAARLLELADAMASAEVAIYADIVADRFIAGEPSRVSREAPVVILEQESDRIVAGGGANAAANVAALAGRAHLYGAIGRDRSGKLLLESLRAIGVDAHNVLARDVLDTPTKTRILGGFGPNKQQIVRIDSGASSTADEATSRDLSARLAERLAAPGADPVLLVSDYGYGSVSPDVVNRLRQSVPTLRVMVDSRHRLGCFAGATVATPNQEEAEALAGQKLDSVEALLRNGHRLRREHDIEHLLITRGSRGMALFAESRVLLIPVWGTDQVRDVTGAGDTVIGTFSLAVAAGAKPAEAAILANFAAGIVVLKAGTATVHPEELRTAIRAAGSFLEQLAWAES